MEAVQGFYRKSSIMICLKSPRSSKHSNKCGLMCYGSGACAVGIQQYTAPQLVCGGQYTLGADA